VDINWQSFDYNNTPKEGVYWLTVHTPEYDVDCDDYGGTIGTPTGEMKTKVVMAHLSVDGDGQVQFDAVDSWAFGEVSAEAAVSHYAPVVIPAPAARAADATPG